MTGEKVAVKILEKEKITEEADVERVSREIHILKLMIIITFKDCLTVLLDKEQLYTIQDLIMVMNFQLFLGGPKQKNNMLNMLLCLSYAERLYILNN